jgi:hypothetical protein
MPVIRAFLADLVRRQLVRASTSAGGAVVGSTLGAACPGPFRLACVPAFGWLGERVGEGPVGDAMIWVDDALGDWNPIPWLLVDYEPTLGGANA